ncbi:MAG: ABC transporter substrate-binding protein [Sulfolobales archaeon]|nr:ABC transporter substrate-binding protein [Sulfolobales archaeon]
MLSRKSRFLVAVFPILIVLSLLGALLAVTVPTSAQTSTNSPTKYPVTPEIYVISYSGNDQAGIQALIHQDIAYYAYQVPLSQISSIPSNFQFYYTPAVLYDVLLNPTNVSYGFNPFMFQQVRYAMNFIVNRTYFVDSILGGHGIPSVTMYTGEPDTQYMLPLVESMNIHYNFTYANITIYKTLTAAGAQYVNGKWYYKGKPITVYVFVRTDTNVRQAYAKYLIAQLEKLGFTVQEVPGNLQKEISLIYGSDPVNATWEVAIEAWGGVYGYYDEGLAEFFVAPVFGAVPASSNISLAFGSFNTTNYQLPSLTKELSIADQIALRLANTNYTNFTQRTELLQQLVEIGFNTSIRVYLGMGLLPYVAIPNMTGLINNYIQGPLNTMSYLTMSDGQPVLKIGVRHLSQGAWNPVAGFQDSYTVELAAATVYPWVWSYNGNGYPSPDGAITWKVVADSPVANVSVPPDAITFNASKGEFQYVGQGSFAKSAVIVNFALMMQYLKFADGQNITMADLLYQIYIAYMVAVYPNSSIYDQYAQSVYSTALSQVVGFKVLNSTAIEIWTSAWYPDPNEIAVTDIGDLFPLGSGLPGGNMFPWTIYKAMAVIVSEKKAAWSSSQAQSLGVDWLSVVNPNDVNMILSVLQQLQANKTIPEGIIEMEKLTNMTLLTPDEAVQDYQLAINFIKTYGNAMIGDGPYILTTYSTTTSPHYAVLSANPYFNLPPSAIPSQTLQNPMTVTLSFTPPVSATNTTPLVITGTVLGTPAGSSEAVGVQGANVTALMFVNGKLVAQNSTLSGPNGTFTLYLPTANLQNQVAKVVMYVKTNSSVLINPQTFSVYVAPSTVTTTSTTTPTSTTSVSASFNSTLVIVAVVVVIIIIAAVVVALRR